MRKTHALPVIVVPAAPALPVSVVTLARLAPPLDARLPFSGRRRKAFCRFACLLFLLLVSFAPAHAGHYDMTSQTGGIGFLFPGPPFPLPYAPYADGYGISFNSGLFGFCNGAIQTTFTWVGDDAYDLPPDTVIIQKQSSVTWSAAVFFPDPSTGGSPGDVSVTGSADDGFGDDAPVAETLIYDWSGTPIGRSNQATSQGTHYRIQTNPGTSFTISCSPSASASVNGAGYFSQGRLQCGGLPGFHHPRRNDQGYGRG